MTTASYVQFTAGPGDSNVRTNELGGYQPYSRVGEVVMNATIMTSEWTSGHAPTNTTFGQWATALPGMIAVAPKADRSLPIRVPGGEATATCIVAIPRLNEYANPPTGGVPRAGQAKADAEALAADYVFRGIVRSPCVRSEDELVMGPCVDEYFTLAIGGAATIQNNGPEKINAGELLCWTFEHTTHKLGNGADAKRYGLGPARIAVKAAVTAAENLRIIGKALSSAKPGQPLDILIKMI